MIFQLIGSFAPAQEPLPSRLFRLPRGFPARGVRPRGLSRPSHKFPICSILVSSMNTRIATAILLAACPFTTVLADTKVILPHYQRFADTGRDFLLQTTIPGDFKTLEGALCGGYSHCHRSARINNSRHFFSLMH